MKKLLSIIITLAIWLPLYAQNKPVSWNFSCKKISANTYNVYLSATVSEPWHIYSETTPAGGPISTKITFGGNPLLKMTGQVSEQGELKVVHDKSFGVDVKYFKGNVSFVQTIKVISKAKTSLHGTIEYMVCNDNKCLPPETIPFDIIMN
jgi:Disulphide bond corrector protein DsbC